MTKLPTKGQRFAIEAHGNLAELGKCRSGRNVWFFRHGTRCRFGNAQEIREDVAHFREYGALPPRAKHPQA